MTAWIKAEKEFESWWTGKLQWAYPFVDTRDARGQSNGTRTFTKARPSDYLVVSNGQTFFAEVKSSQDAVSFNLNNIEPMQWTAAIRSVAAKGLYFFFIKSQHLNTWFRVPASVLVEQRKIKKSIRWTDLQPFTWTPNGTQ